MKQSPTDDELIVAYLSGDESAFDLLYERYRRILYGYLKGLLIFAPAEVDDLYQQCWIKSVDKLGKYRLGSSFGAWLLRIGRNLVIDRARRAKVRGFELSLDDENMPELFHVDNNAAWLRMDEELFGRLLGEGVASLPMEQREVFELRRNDVAFKDIAEVQACSINTVLGRMQYACKSLRRHIEQYFAGGIK